MGGGTELGRVRGLGSAHHGSHHWLLQRFTAAGNLLTVLYLVFSLILLHDMSYVTVIGWLTKPMTQIAMALLIVSVFWHARLGLQVMIEDYVHDGGRRFAVLLVLNLLAFAGAAAGLFFLLQIAMLPIAQSAAASSASNLAQMLTSGAGAR